MKIITIRIIGNDDTELFNGLVTELPLKEEYVIEKSMERFNESEPCIIYRTHIGKIFFFELYEKLEDFRNKKINKIMCSDLSEYFNNVNLDTQRAVIYIN